MNLIKHLKSLDGIHHIKHTIFSRIHIDPLVTLLYKAGVHPNHITIFNILIGLIALWGLFVWPWYWVSLLLILHFFLDNLDGYLARTRNLGTKLGDILDHGGDFLLGCLFLAKNSYHYQLWWMWLSLALFILTEIIILNRKWHHETFPSRINMIGYLFGSYYISMIVQVIFQPLIFLWFVCYKIKTNNTK
jgi:phosphatidylglycerophosphate synthase